MSKHISTLRICGLTNPNHALNRTEKAISDGDHLGKLLSRFSDEAYKVVRGEGEEPIVDFKSSCVLLPSGLDLKTSSGLYLENDLFKTSLHGYSFRHLFIKNGPQHQAPFISCIEIDKKVVSQTQQQLGEGEFHRFEKALGVLFALANHDATTHAYGVITGGGKKNYLNSLLGRQLGFGENVPRSFKINPGELAAATFHRDMFEEIDELSNPRLPLKKTILHNTKIVLEFLSRLDDIHLKPYWEMVLKYPLFSLIDPNGEDIAELREKYGEINLCPTRWGKLVHRNTNKCKLSYMIDELIEISLRDIRKIMMDKYRSGKPIGNDLSILLAEKGGYPPPKNTEDLERMMRARSFGLPLDTGKKTLELYLLYKRFLNRDPFTQSIFPLFDYEKYLLFKKNGFDTSLWDDPQKWKELFIKDIKNKIQEYKKTRLERYKVEIMKHIEKLHYTYNFYIDMSDFPELMI